jgi:hypothetical protein
MNPGFYGSQRCLASGLPANKPEPVFFVEIGGIVVGDSSELITENSPATNANIKQVRRLRASSARAENAGFIGRILHQGLMMHQVSAVAVSGTRR